MPIAVACPCGKKMQVKSELAGKRVRCPACKEPIRIPDAAPAAAPPAAAMGNDLSDLFEEEGMSQRQGATCPNCTKDMKPGAILCLNCGFNTQTGESVKGYQTEAERTLLGHTLLDKAHSDMENEVVLQKKLQGVGMPWWMLLIILMIVTGVAISLVIGVSALTSEDKESSLYRPSDFTTLATTVQLEPFDPAV